MRLFYLKTRGNPAFLANLHREASWFGRKNKLQLYQGHLVILEDVGRERNKGLITLANQEGYTAFLIKPSHKLGVLKANITLGMSLGYPIHAGKVQGDSRELYETKQVFLD